MNATQTPLLAFEHAEMFRTLSSPAMFCAVIALVQLGFFFFQHVLPAIFEKLVADRLLHRGPHYDSLARDDLLFIGINKMLTWVMVYHTFIYALSSHSCLLWELKELRVINTLVTLVALFVVYDLFYSLFHRALHHRSIYRFVHKHHHRQVVPTRGLLDSVNVHPLEYLGGEYFHLLAIHLVSHYMLPLHVMMLPIFLGGGGVLAALNHTRLDVRIQLPFIATLYDVRAHDTHHCRFVCNYAQYTMVWDRLLGTYKEYDAEWGKSWHRKEL
mmetsp:Transcript_48843/g.81176  ORF Transcript_48843/g.81176 Transcript_48843/m.81176 type:complete len:271 (-) Transcript_48843:155-967(-)